MLTYIYFVKCPDCEDEHFDFFNEAKEFALNCLSKKPIITQIEVNRNDFGECTDSCDLGTVWSWEDVMKDIPAEPVQTTFTKADTLEHNDCSDPEFDFLDNSLTNDLTNDTDNLRKPIPAGMTVKDLVEELEENEDTVECKWCEELFDKSECRYEVDLGWLCDRCQAAIMSRGEPLTFRENPYSDSFSLEESFDPEDEVEFNYDGLRITLQGPKRDVDDWDEIEHVGSYTYTRTKEDVATTIWENFIEEADVEGIEGGLETLEDDAAWNDFLATHFDDLLDKYYDKLLDYYSDWATEEFEDTYSWDDLMADRKAEYDDYEYERQRDYKYFGESTQKSFLEEFDEAESSETTLADCPECGTTSYNMKEQYCTNCGFNL